MMFPALPKEIRRGTIAQIANRQRERVLVCEGAFPGVRFSPAGTNVLGVKYAKEQGVPGAGLPRAIFHRVEGGVDNQNIVEAVVNSLKELNRFAPYTTFTSLALESNLDFEQVFAVLTELLDAERVTMTVDRLGYPVAVRLIK